MPDLNGIELVRSLRKLAVPPKIIFVSQESSPEVVREALNLGGLAYVQKMRAGSDLLPAIESALEGRRFVSKGLKGGQAKDNTTHAPHYSRFLEKGKR